jgi:Ca-activated chloride channel family protein
MNITASTDRQLARAAGHSTRYVLATVTAPEAPRRQERTPVNVALVLDRSGSMGGEKITLARTAVERALQLLRPEDRFALVVYDTVVDVLMESAPATADARQEASRRLAQIGARGGTDLGSGWLRGCEQVARFLESRALGRCLLLTDGLANQGIVDHDTLIQHARELRERGVVTSTFGVGADFDEKLLQRMAEAGAGHFYFIERAVQIPDLLMSELGETLEIVARDVTVEAQAPQGAAMEALNPWPVERTPDGVSIALGDLVSSQQVSLVFKLVLPAGAEGQRIGGSFSVRDSGGAALGTTVSAEWTFASHEANDRQTRNAAVDRAVAELYAARATAAAVDANSRGDHEAARHVVQATAAKIASYAGSHDEVREVAQRLVASLSRYETPLDPMTRKQLRYGSYAEMASRTPIGVARRSS